MFVVIVYTILVSALAGYSLYGSFTSLVGVAHIAKNINITATSSKGERERRFIFLSSSIVCYSPEFLVHATPTIPIILITILMVK